MRLTPEQLDRHKRHLLVHDIGGPGIQKLAGARVIIVGAGALGGPCAMYLAAAGVGEIWVYDDDEVDLSNLQRQIQFGENDLGKSKAECLIGRLSAMNGTIRTHSVSERVSPETVLPSGILIDATDNFYTRFLLNTIAHKSGRYLISGAANVWAGQVSVFASGVETGAPCYQCWVPQDPENDDNCDTLGVVGPITGLIGARMALETIKVITGAGQPLLGRLWILDGRSGDSRIVRLSSDPGCKTCGSDISL